MDFVACSCGRLEYCVYFRLRFVVNILNGFVIFLCSSFLVKMI